MPMMLNLPLQEMQERACMLISSTLFPVRTEVWDRPYCRHAQSAHFSQDQRSFHWRHRIQTLSPATISRGTIADVVISDAAPKLIPLPSRLAPVDPSSLPWQQNIGRVGQST
jgi:hypothetical protein